MYLYIYIFFCHIFFLSNRELFPSGGAPLPPLRRYAAAPNDPYAIITVSEISKIPPPPIKSPLNIRPFQYDGDEDKGIYIDEHFLFWELYYFLFFFFILLRYWEMTIRSIFTDYLTTFLFSRTRSAAAAASVSVAV